MTEFKTLQLNDKEIIDKYIGSYEYGTYEYAFSTLYMWRKMCNPYYAILQDSLIIRKEEKEKGQYFMAPIGASDEKITAIVAELSKIKAGSGNMPYLFRDIEEDYLQKFISIYGDKVTYVEDENNFDYIYEVNELIELPGKKFHSKKNHFNSFKKTYDYIVKDIKDEDTAAKCIHFAGQWLKEKSGVTEELKYELTVIEDIITNSEALGIQGMAVFVQDEVVAFSLGEKLKEEMAVIHIEKGNSDYKGVYAFINKVFLHKYFADVKFVNRQEDLGIKGLRKAKQSYHPVKLEKKFNVNIEV